MLKKLLLIILFTIIGAAVLAGLYFWNEVSWPAADADQEVIFTISQGEGVKEIGASLKERGLIRNTFWFETYVFLDSSQAKFMAGNYKLARNMNTREVVRILTSGTPANENVITILEGWNIEDIADYLDEQGIAQKDDFIAAARATDSRTIIPGQTYDFLADKPATADLEGYLFPDTYRVYLDSTPGQIIEKMLDNFGTKFTEQMRAAAGKGNMSIFQIVTLASIIEKEVRTDQDRKIVAGIFYDRLNVGVALQSDATVNYVTGKKALQPTDEDISVDNPYNTYKNKGLPAGPISNPSLAAISAAIYPEKSDYFYFLTKPDGSTVFSKTYEEHLENKRKYLQ